MLDAGDRRLDRKVSSSSVTAAELADRRWKLLRLFVDLLGGRTVTMKAGDACSRLRRVSLKRQAGFRDAMAQYAQLAPSKVGQTLQQLTELKSPFQIDASTRRYREDSVGRLTIFFLRPENVVAAE